MFLSDRDIRAELAEGGLIISPLADGAIQPASVDVRLGVEWMFLRYQPGPLGAGRVPDGDYAPFRQNALDLLPGQFVLATTLEHIEVPPHLLVQVNGKSTWARKGLTIHQTAGFVDPGFRGNITLELVNLGPRPILLTAGDFIAQLAVARLASPAEQPYHGRYQGQEGVTGAR